MKAIDVNGTQVILYSSIKELPVDLAKKFQRQLLQDLGIGNTIEDVDDHLGRLMEFVKADKKDEAIEEIKNLRYNLFTQLSEWDYRSLGFACLVHSLGGQVLTDYSDEGLAEITSRLSAAGLTTAMVQDVLEDVKKNLIKNGKYIFPTSSDQILTTLTGSANF